MILIRTCFGTQYGLFNCRMAFQTARREIPVGMKDSS